MTLDADHVIVGAGCAGLLLAVRLATRSPRSRGRVVVLDPRTTLGGDRTWCYFRGAPHPFEAAVTQRYPRIRVVAGGRVIERDLGARTYEHVDSSRFVEVAQDTLARAADVEVRLGLGAESIVPEGDSVRVTTSRGPLRARLVWDARGGLPAERRAPDDVCWTQHFVGWVVRTERPIFVPGTATLMDFGVAQDHGPHFVYVLPFGRHEALVEDTYFSETPRDEREYAATLEAWLARHGAGRFEVVRTERGRLPMRTATLAPRAHPRVVPIGLRGGSAKPSTGYAFTFIQRHVDALSRAVGDGSLPPPEIAPRSAVSLFFDRVFLAYLRRHPDRGPEVFGALFSRTDPRRLCRFLSEEGTAADYLAVMNGVPRLGVAAEAVRSSRLWMRA